MALFNTSAKNVACLISLLACALSTQDAAKAGAKFNPNVALSSSQITDAPFIFQAGFDSATWSGSLKKTAIVQKVDASITLAKESEWDAGVLLTNSSAKRTIATYNPVIKQTVLFTFHQLPTSVQAHFNLKPGTNVQDNLGVQRVNYLSGDRSMESNDSSPAADGRTAGYAKSLMPNFRIRSRLLGDIIHSTPVYVGAPAKNIIDPSYPAFYAQHKTRPGTVFVGANDGMLHAFSADSGVELFAYIPSPLLSKLPPLTDRKYQHQPSMDGNLRVAEARIAGTWKTVLAAGMGKGAKGVFALDVTTPEHFMEGQRALLEFTDNDDADMGYLTSSPQIAKIKISKNTGGQAGYQYFLIVPSGFHSTDTNVDTSHSGNGSFLFLLSLDKDPAVPWSQNHNYYKFSVNNLNHQPPFDANVLSAPGLAFDAQGAAIYGYSGDWQGNLWRFDFTDHNLASVIPKIIFSASDQHHQPQPITVQPTLSFAPGGGYLVLFGTGKDAEDSDYGLLGFLHNRSERPSAGLGRTGATGTSVVVREDGEERPNPDHGRAVGYARSLFSQNSFYAIHDTINVSKENSSTIDRSQLAKRELVPTRVHGQTGYQLTGDDVSYGNAKSDKKGWYFDYLNGVNTGERSVCEALLLNGMIFFNTVIPHTGSGASYRVNAITGRSANSGEIAGSISHTAPGIPLLITAPPSPGNRDSTGRRISLQPYSVIHFGNAETNSAAETIHSGSITLKAGRFGWREISNWQEIRKEAVKEVANEAVKEAVKKEADK